MYPHQDEKNSWPELVGKPFAEAETVILRDRPDCHVVHIKPGTPMIRNLDFERVFVVTKGDGDFIVEMEPRCG